MPRIVEPTPDMLMDATYRLRDGAVVVFPTETVYGLGADTFNSAAIDEVYALKGRPGDNPLIAHVLGAVHARQLTIGWDDRCSLLAERFWPGPLTFVVRKSDKVPARATAGLSTIAVRSPRHPVARALLESFGGPLSAPSANRSGHVSPTTARHVADEFPAAHDLLILDGGPCPVGIESTVLDLTGITPRILRRGSVTEQELHEAVGLIQTPQMTEQGASPGTSLRHYAPRTPAEIVAPDLLAQRLAELTDPVVVLCFDAEAVPSPHCAIEMPQGAGDYGRRLYDALRRADAMRLERLVIESPPGSNDMWKAILDRLDRATS